MNELVQTVRQAVASNQTLISQSHEMVQAAELAIWQSARQVTTVEETLRKLNSPCHCDASRSPSTPAR